MPRVPKFEIVAARDVLEHMTQGDAEALLRRLIDADPGARRELERMAEELDFAFFGGVREAIEIVARVIAQGRIVPVRRRSRPRPLDPPRVVDLRELGDDRPLMPLSPSGPGDTPPTLPATTWVSFDVVDDERRPAQGRFRLAVDALVESGDLDGSSHRRGELRPHADVRLLVQGLSWGGAPAPEPITPGKIEPAISVDVAADELSIEVVDADGRRLRARYEIHREEKELGRGSVSGQMKWKAPQDGGPGAVTVRLVELGTLD